MTSIWLKVRVDVVTEEGDEVSEADLEGPVRESVCEALVGTAGLLEVDGRVYSIKLNRIEATDFDGTT